MAGRGVRGAGTPLTARGERRGQAPLSPAVTSEPGGREIAAGLRGGSQWPGGGRAGAALTVWALGRTHGHTDGHRPGVPMGTRGSGMCRGFMQRVTRAGIKPAR